jgi:diadenosine tetraphosphate (Ap4A) HIT family hydrolase
MQDGQLQKALAPKLQHIFDALKQNPNLQAAPDDLAVFDALRSNGISQYTAWKTRQVDQWQCAYNPLRTLRPERASKEVFTGLEKPFDDNAFHFAKPFLRPEIISEEVSDGMELQIMYHKFPFAPYHLLIVINALQQRPQFLDEATHNLTWQLAIHVEKNIKNFGLAYNSLGAGASVNHLHIHGFVNQAFAIEHKSWQHNGGERVYPLDIFRFDKAGQSWQAINTLHKQNQPYNLLYRAGVCYVIPRKPASDVELPGWLSSVGWTEACGSFNLSDENNYQALTSDNILTTLRLFNTENTGV